MRIKTNQKATFADSLINIPTSQLDIVKDPCIKIKYRLKGDFHSFAYFYENQP